MHGNCCLGSTVCWKREKTPCPNGQAVVQLAMIDLSEERLEENLQTCAAYLKRMSAIDMHLEIELGVTGGKGRSGQHRH